MDAQSIAAWRRLTWGGHWARRVAAVSALGCLSISDASVLEGRVRPRQAPAGQGGLARTEGTQAAQAVLAGAAEVGHATLKEDVAGLRSMAGGGQDTEYRRRLESRLRSLETLDQRVTAAETAVRVAQQAADESWLLISSTLVLMMTISGLALFYGGLVRVQNVLATVMQSFAIACVISVLWIAVGYSLCFTEGSPVLGSYHRYRPSPTSAWWCRGVSLAPPEDATPRAVSAQARAPTGTAGVPRP